MKDKKIIRLTESDLEKIIKETILKFLNSKDIISEGISNTVYHYTSFRNLLKMLKNNKLYFNRNERANNKDNMRALSTTRNRNSVQGYAFMQSGDNPDGGGTTYNGEFGYYFIRLEFDGRALQNLQYCYRNKHTTLKGGPFDYVYHFNKGENELGGYDILNSKEEISAAINDGSFNEFEDYYYHQPYSQAEDRIYSKKANVVGLDKVLRRIDVLIRYDKLIEYGEFDREIFDFFNTIKFIKENYGDLVHIYNKRSAFDIQKGNEMTLHELYNLMNRLI